MLQYEVGTILWIIHRDRPGLVAYRVVEEITKKTLDGEKIQYTVQPAVPKAKKVQLESIKGRIFLDSEEAKQALIENATRAIDSMIEKTQNLVNRFLHVQKPKALQSSQTLQTPAKQDSVILKPGYQWVEMEDGDRIQVKIPESLL